MIARLISLVVAVALLAAAPAPLAAQTDEQVDEAVKKLHRYLYDSFDKDAGNWEGMYAHPHGGDGAISSMIVAALLLSGESAQRPEIASAIKYIQKAKNELTYGVSLRAHVWGQLSNQYLTDMKREARWLEAAADAEGQFTYTAPPKFSFTPEVPVAKHDHSCSHYGALGLWEASKRGVEVSPSFWRAAKNHWIKVQKADGGWSYNDPRDEMPYGSMTAAAVTVLLIAQQELYRERVVPDEEITKSIDAGLRWLDTHFSGYRNPVRDGSTGYYLYAIERVALASGVRYFNNEDWFRIGAQYFIGAQRDDGSIGNGPVDSCFALMFLARGRVPVWANKIRVDGARWNNRPNDLYYLTDFLSQNFEHEVNWQVIGIAAPPAEWLSAPVAYIASDRELTLNDAEIAALKRYIDLGGLLVASPDNGSEQFADSVRLLAGRLYPHLKMQALKPDHPLFRSLHQLGDMTATQPIYSVNNGARDLIVLAGRDWGFNFQTERSTTENPTATFKLATNLYALATDRGRLPNRLDPTYEQRQDRPASATITIGRARYDGNWLVEPLAWEQLANHVFNMTGVHIAIDEGVDLSRIGTSNLPLVHLTGATPIELSRVEQASIRRYIRSGGTLLIETVGGQAGFARDLERQIQALFHTGARPLDNDDPILTAKGLIGGYDNRTVEYRPYRIIHQRAGRQPRLAAFYIDNRPAILISGEDLSLGILGVRHWGIHGYSPRSAKFLMTNIALWAYERSKQP